jgi:ribosomal-protein-alanine N-acetyltransferase
MMKLERTSANAGHWTEQQYREAFDLGSPERLVLAAETKPDSHRNEDSIPALVGFLVVLHVAPEWELENIVVAPSGRRTGIGRQLLNSLFEVARKTSSNAIFLEVRESNTAARAFYENADFAPTGRRTGYYSSPIEDAVLYRLGLN